MTSPAGGHFIFTNPAGGGGINLGIKDGAGDPVFPTAKNSQFNIEVFTGTNIPLATQPGLDSGFQAGAVAPRGTLQGGFLVANALQLFVGDYKVTDVGGPSTTPAVVILGSGNQTVVGSAGDTLIGGSGNQLIDTLSQSGAEYIIGGTGNYTVYGGFGSTIKGSANATASTTAQIVATAGKSGNVAANITVELQKAGNETISAGGGDTITSAIGNANAAITAGISNFINLTGNIGNVTVDARLGNDTVIAGGGSETIFGGPGDSIVGGTGTLYVDGSLGGMTITGGSAGNELIIGSIANGAADDTILGGGGANLIIQGLGAGDLVNLSNSSGNSTVNATAGNNRVTLGTGHSTVYGGAGDTITFGSGDQYVDGSLGGMTIQLGTAGTDNVIGSGTGGGHDTILGGAANLNYNPQIGGSGDLIDLSGDIGKATINAFSSEAPDTIHGSITADSVWGGAGDRIGVGSSVGVFGAGGTHTWEHSSPLAGGAIAFGTFDTVVAADYGDSVQGNLTVDHAKAGASSATATIGAGGGEFIPGQDFLFYQNETQATDDAIVATAKATVVGGIDSSTVTLPDGTTITLVGVTLQELQVTNSNHQLFKA